MTMWSYRGNGTGQAGAARFSWAKAGASTTPEQTAKSRITNQASACFIEGPPPGEISQASEIRQKAQDFTRLTHSARSKKRPAVELAGVKRGTSLQHTVASVGSGSTAVAPGPTYLYPTKPTTIARSLLGLPTVITDKMPDGRGMSPEPRWCRSAA